MADNGPKNKDWREIARRIHQETDPEKVLELVQELIAIEPLKVALDSFCCDFRMATTSSFGIWPDSIAYRTAVRRVRRPVRAAELVEDRF
jgi:hypothetical protein